MNDLLGFIVIALSIAATQLWWKWMKKKIKAKKGSVNSRFLSWLRKLWRWFHGHRWGP